MAPGLVERFIEENEVRRGVMSERGQWERLADKGVERFYAQWKREKLDTIADQME